MITSYKLVNISVTSQINFLLVFMVEYLRSTLFTNFKCYNTVLLTVVTILYMNFQNLFILPNWFFTLILKYASIYQILIFKELFSKGKFELILYEPGNTYVLNIMDIKIIFWKSSWWEAGGLSLDPRFPETEKGSLQTYATSPWRRNISEDLVYRKAGVKCAWGS